MKDFNGKIAVVTGGGTGMGRELVRQLAAEGASVAMCDVFAEIMAATKRLCESDGLPQGARITTHVADVADEDQLNRFAAEVARQHETDRIHLLFNNAGIGGGASFVNAPREEWERVFNICWKGVYLSCRAFMPMLLRAEEGAVVNTSSANGFWAALMPNVTHTAYSAAKFAVKGFTEALITDFRNNAPHLKAHIVMPGGVGTPIAGGSWSARMSRGSTSACAGARRPPTTSTLRPMRRSRRRNSISLVEAPWRLCRQRTASLLRAAGAPTDLTRRRAKRQQSPGPGFAGLTAVR